MQKRHFYTCLLIWTLMAAPCTLTAQEKPADADLTERIIADIYEQMAESSEEEIDFASFYDDLYQFTQNPINLNTATKDELEHLQFLSDEQIDHILYYVHRNGPMRTIYELQLIDGLASYDIRNLLPFVVVGDVQIQKQPFSFKRMFKYGKNELLFRIDRGVETKEGYRYTPEEDEQGITQQTKKYAGDPFYTSLKYRFRYSDKVHFGLSAEKDAGEQFWGKQHKGYDFYAGYLQVNDVWKFTRIVLGDYRANFGQGLVIRPEMGFGKSSYVLNVSTRNSGLKKYTSTDEYNFFRGGGATVRLGKFDITAFYSNKMIDGALENGTFASIYKTGLHRTQSELDKKRTIRQQVAGGNATFNYKSIRIGLTVQHTSLSDTLMPASAAYSTNYFSGKQQTVGGVHYAFKAGRVNFFGETAVADNAAVATLNGVRYSPVSQVGLVALYRWYSPRFDNLFATAFGETSRINNEKGLYIGAEVRPIKRWKFAAYADGYAFMYPKYGIDQPSTGFDYLLQADFATHRYLNMYWRVKWEKKAANLTGVGTTPTVELIDKASLRYNLNYSAGRFSFKTVAEGNLAKQVDGTTTWGMAVSQDLNFRLQKIPLTMNVRFQIFDAQSYENRVYSYEKDVLYAFSIPSYYGMGSRYYVNINYDITKRLTLWFKAAQTVYADDRESQSSGGEQINGNRKTDLRLMVRWQF